MRNEQKHRNNVAKRTNRKNWSKEDLKEAVRLVIDEKKPLDWAESATGVPRETVRRYVLKARVNPEGSLVVVQPGPPTILTELEEDDVEKFIFAMSDMGCGLTSDHINSVVLELLGERHHPFNKGKGPGRDWWEAFLRRHPKLSLRVGDKLDKARACNDNVNVMQQFMDTLETLYEKHQFTADIIFNVDETKTEPKWPKVLARKGTRTVYILTPPPLPHTTIVACISAAGKTMPPLIINTGKTISDSWFCEGMIEGTQYAATESGWIDSAIFIKWFEHFVRWIDTIRRPGQQALLIFDGHESHVSLNLVKLAEKAHVVLLQLPPHTTHRVQPLDLACFCTWHREFGKMLHTHTVHHPREGVTKDIFARLMTPAWQKAMSASNIRSGFAKAGIFPFDAQKFMANYRKNAGGLSPATAVDQRPSSIAGPAFSTLPAAPSVSTELTPTNTLLGKRKLEIISILHDMEQENSQLRHAIELQKSSHRRDLLRQRLPLADVTNQHEASTGQKKKRRRVSGAQVLTQELFEQRVKEAEDEKIRRQEEKKKAQAEKKKAQAEEKKAQAEKKKADAKRRGGGLR